MIAFKIMLVTYNKLEGWKFSNNKCEYELYVQAV